MNGIKTQAFSMDIRKDDTMKSVFDAARSLLAEEGKKALRMIILKKEAKSCKLLISYSYGKKS